MFDRLTAASASAESVSHANVACARGQRPVSVPHASGVTNLDAAWDEPRLDEGPALYTKTVTVCGAR
jgi:hypothetical protein